MFHLSLRFLFRAAFNKTQAIHQLSYSPILETRDCGIVFDNRKLIKLFTNWDESFCFVMGHGGFLSSFDYGNTADNAEVKQAGQYYEDTLRRALQTFGDE